MSSDFPSATRPNQTLDGIPSVAALTTRAREQLHRLTDTKSTEASLPILTAIVQDLVDFSRIQHEINRRIQDVTSSFPTRHAATHRGGSDSVMARTLPSEIDLGVVSALGTPQLGAATANHVHGTTPSLDGLVELMEIEVDSQGRASVYDDRLRLALEELLIASMELRDVLLDVRGSL